MEFIRAPKSNRFVTSPSSEPTPKATPQPKRLPIDPGLQVISDKYLCDPLSFVQDMWPWAQENGPLADQQGLDTWQEEVLILIRDHYQRNTTDSLLIAIASGHGVGKTALSVFILLWFLSVHAHCHIVVTASAGHQLSTKTWRELAKWLRISALTEYFVWSATKCSSRSYPETWFAAAITNNASKPEAFAGLHEGYVCILMDEASGIEDIIWDTIEGALTSGKALWVAMGNPLNPAGRFRQCFPGGRDAQWWTSLNVDSRSAKMADKSDIARKIAAHGEDSDYVKMRIRGEFPARGSQQLIGEEMLRQAKVRTYVQDRFQPILIGVDPARYGDCRSVILIRQGARILEIKTYSDMDGPKLAGFVIAMIDAYSHEHAPYCFIDSIGIGASVYDQCVHRGYKVHGVFSGNPANDDQHYANKRAEMADLTKEWLLTFACLEDHRELEADMLGIQYFYNIKGQLQIESKEDMRARGMASPDLFDALSYTFAERVRLGSPRRQDYAIGAASPHYRADHHASRQQFATSTRIRR